jgi:excinuclease ABC subunit C
VVTRYLTRRRDEEKPLPDLMVIDGGKGQLGAAVEAAEGLGLTQIPFVGLAKRDEEVFFPKTVGATAAPPEEALAPPAAAGPRRSPPFGLAYNRVRRSARTITSALLEIPGVGRRAPPPACWSASAAWPA